MGKLKASKIHKTKLTADQKQFGKTQIAILLTMIVVGLALALYNMQ